MIRFWQKFLQLEDCLFVCERNIARDNYIDRSFKIYLRNKRQRYFNLIPSALTFILTVINTVTRKLFLKKFHTSTIILLNFVHLYPLAFCLLITRVVSHHICSECRKNLARDTNGTKCARYHHFLSLL